MLSVKLTPVTAAAALVLVRVMRKAVTSPGKIGLGLAGAILIETPSAATAATGATARPKPSATAQIRPIKRRPKPRNLTSDTPTIPEPLAPNGGALGSLT